MKKGIILVLTIAVVSVGSVSAGTYSGGDGSAEKPYRISTAADMNEIGAHREDRDKHFVLTADIDLSGYTGTEFNIIGTGYIIGTDFYNAFTGVFDGNNHTISNFTYTTTDAHCIGLFGCVSDSNAAIKDLTLTDPNVGAGRGWAIGSLVGWLESGTITGCGIEGGSVSGYSGVGGLVGDNWGTISNCYAAGSVSGTDYTGGLVGLNDGTIINCSTTGSVSGGHYDTGGLVGSNGGTICTCHSSASVSGHRGVGGLVGFNCGGLIASNCYSTGSVEGNGWAGGLVGGNYEGTVKNCYSTSEVSTNDGYAGGLVGESVSNSTISNSYGTGGVTGNTCTGGLVGHNQGSTIENCYAVGLVVADANAGGLVGYEEDGTVSGCFWDVNSSGLDISAGGEGKTTAEMMTESTFTDAGWDFVGETQNGVDDIWTISEGDYPKLTPQAAFYGGGYGLAGCPYQIRTREHMNEIGTKPEDWDKYFILMADVNLACYTGTEFNIIGHYEDWGAPDNEPFSGVFDGNGHTISNFTYITTDTDYIGLFGYVEGTNVMIKNLTLADSNVNAAGESDDVGCLVGYLRFGTITGCGIEGGSVTGRDYTGGLVGYNRWYGTGTISNCYATASVTGRDYTGGLVGVNDYGTISNCYAAGSVAGEHCIGGLVGYNGYRGTISNCYAESRVSGGDWTGGLVGGNGGTVSDCYTSGDISGTYSASVGGLVGCNYTFDYSGIVKNCYSSGSVDGSDMVGGLIGENQRGSSIENCYAVGRVVADANGGGLVGYNDQGTISASFWDIETTEQQSSSGGEGKTTAEMQTMSTFFGWGCITPVWTIDEGRDYPHLAWEEKPGEPLAPILADLLEGAGTQERPYLISTAEELNVIGLFVYEFDKYFKVTADIDLSVYTGTEFNIIGTSWTSPFTGVFDGSGHTISNFTYTTTDTDGIGLFSYVEGANAVIKDLILVAPDVNAAGDSDYVASLVGRLESGTIVGCGIDGGSVSGDQFTGGLAGCNSGGTISNSYATGSVSGRSYTGGLVGYNYGTISNCYAAGSVTGDSYTGGLVGYNRYGVTISASFWDFEIGGLYNGIGTPLSTSQMQTMSTFTDAGWDFVTPIWTIDEGNDYPRLWYIPIADAGANKIVYAWIDGWAEVELDGSASFDLNGDELTYLWSWTVDGDTYDVNGVDPVIELPVGEYVISLTVNDGTGDSEPDQVVITVIEALESRLLISPRVINRYSGQKNILAWIRLPEGVDKEQISDEPILLYPGEIEAVRQYVIEHGRAGRRRTSVLAFFDKAELMDAVVDDGRVELEAVGSLTSGRYFYGTDTVQIKGRQWKPQSRWR